MEDPDHNNTALYFLLTGFPSLQNFQLLLFSVFLVFYLLILAGNVMILCAVVLNRSLHRPMYFFLSNLSILDILCATTTVPKMLMMFLLNDKQIAPRICFTQMYFFHGLAVTESFLLVVMAYDRYMAICNPLHYATKMTNSVNILLSASAWISGMLVVMPVVIQASQLKYCALTTVIHCFCDHLSVVQASCSSDTTFESLAAFSLAMGVASVPLLLVSSSYLNIIISILKINSKDGRTKAFSTCTSHLTVVIIYYTSIAVSYVSYKVEMAVDFHIMGNVIFGILTPMVNPMIYTLRNKEVKDAMAKIIHLKSRGAM